ncbi:MAG: 50S ribosomal protein L24 [Gammaproteobacteria bacterium]
MLKIKKGDTVIVTAGKDKGKVGSVEKLIFPKTIGCPRNSTYGYRVIVKGVNLVKKHVKANPAQNIEGGIITKEASLHISNVAIYNASSNKADKVRFNADKVRIYKSTGDVING